MALTREGAVYMWGNFEVSEKYGFEFGESLFTKTPHKVPFPDVSSIVNIAIGTQLWVTDISNFQDPAALLIFQNIILVFMQLQPQDMFGVFSKVFPADL
jgi:hypothetical protein